MSSPAPSPAPRAFDLAAGPASSGATFSSDLEAAAAQRLGSFALVVAVLSGTIGMAAQIAGTSSVLGAATRLSLVAVIGLLAFGLHTSIAKGWLSPSRALRVGLAFQMLHAFLASTVFYSLVLAPGLAIRGWTPVAVMALVYPLIVPARPSRVWASTLATAAMDPLSLWVIVAAGAARPSATDLGQMFLPTAVACIIAPLAARIVYGLTAEVKRAREMGSYHLVEKLGEGGMGEVWRAEHRMLARGAAIKLIRPAALGAGEASNAREMVKRFEREARATAALRSPHTIEVYDYGVAPDGTFHYVMELLEGFSLQTLVARFGPIPPERAVGLLRQACHSLTEAHAAGLVHRDVKPANLFVCRLGLDVDFVKVLDFGLVKFQGRQAEGAEALTMEGGFAGTPSFMPPEVALAASPIDGRADIYALGCVAYWLVTGRLVFESANAMQMVIDHVRTPPVPPSRRTDQAIPEGLERIILRCLEKEPDARPSSIAALSLELQELGIERLWTDARARDWWREHLSSAAGAEGASLDPDLSHIKTRSQTGRMEFGRV